MDFTSILRQAWRLSWRHRPLLFLGLIAAAGRSLLPAINAWRFPGLQQQVGSDPAVLLEQLSAISRSPETAAGLLLGLFFLLLIIWLSATIAEAGLIDLVSEIAHGRPVTISTGLQAGRRRLPSLIAIDTIVFFPLFLVLLLILLLVSGILIYFFLTQPATPNLSQLPRSVSTAALCLFPLLALTIPVTLLTLFWRAIAFRELIITGRSIRNSLRAVRPLIRRHWVTLFILLVAAFLPTAAASIGLRLLRLPLQQVTFTPLLTAGLELIFSTTLLTPAIALSSAIWTLGFIEINKLDLELDLD